MCDTANAQKHNVRKEGRRRRRLDVLLTAAGTSGLFFLLCMWRRFIKDVSHVVFMFLHKLVKLKHSCIPPVKSHVLFLFYTLPVCVIIMILFITAVWINSQCDCALEQSASSLLPVSSMLPPAGGRWTWSSRCHKEAGRWITVEFQCSLMMFLQIKLRLKTHEQTDHSGF